MKTARKAGIKTKETSKKTSPYTPSAFSRRTLPTHLLGSDDRHSPVSDDQRSGPRQNFPTRCIFSSLVSLTVVFVEGSSERGAVATTCRPPVTLDQMYERLYCKDYIRLGFMATSSSQRLRGEAWRVSLVNSSYNVCKRY